MTFDPHKNQTEIRQGSSRKMNLRALLIGLGLLVLAFAIIYFVFASRPNDGEDAGANAGANTGSETVTNDIPVGEDDDAPAGTTPDGSSQTETPPVGEDTTPQPAGG